jgi:peptide-methionine (S)-S-oxide reductase
MGLFSRHLPEMIDADGALPGRAQAMAVPSAHYVNGHPMVPPFPDGLERAEFAMGCFWGEERRYWEALGVWTTAVGYAGGFTPNPTYEEVCSGRTGHAEAVLVVWDPKVTTYEALLKTFWEGHDPTQGMRQGNDVGTQYRSMILVSSAEQRLAAETSMVAYQKVLDEAGHGPITTEIVDVGPFYYAEAYHQQYLAKNPGGYCGSGGTGVSCPIGLTGAG